MSLYSHVSGSITQPTVETESHKSLPTKSVASHSGTSGILDTDTPDIHSMFSEDIELSQYKSPAELSTTKSQSHKGTLSVDIQSDIRSKASTGYWGSPVSPCRSRSIPPSRQSVRKPSEEMTDFEREFFSEDYMSGDEDDDENFIRSLTPSGLESESLQLGSEKYKDFLRCLPVHLSKRILGMLDKNSLTNCLCLSKHWRVLAEEVKQDYMVHQLMTEEIMLMQVSFLKKRDIT